MADETKVEAPAVAEAAADAPAQPASENADAASEFRRALNVLNEGKSRSTPFFLNPERLKVACAQALERLGFRSR